MGDERHSDHLEEKFTKKTRERLLKQYEKEDAIEQYPPKSMYAIVTIVQYCQRKKGESKLDMKMRIKRNYLRKTGMGRTAINVFLQGWMPRKRKVHK